MKIEIKVVPSSKKSEFLEDQKGNYRIYVKSPAKKGKANKELIEVVAKHFEVRKSDVKIVKGEKSREKVIEILE